MRVGGKKAQGRFLSTQPYLTLFSAALPAHFIFTSLLHARTLLLRSGAVFHADSDFVIFNWAYCFFSIYFINFGPCLYFLQYQSTEGVANETMDCERWNWYRHGELFCEWKSC